MEGGKKEESVTSGRWEDSNWQLAMAMGCDGSYNSAVQWRQGAELRKR